MRVGIDIQTTLGNKTGFGFYVKNLVTNLKKLDHKNQYCLFEPDFEKDLSTPQRFIWDQWGVYQKAKNAKIDILHQPCFSAPLMYSGKIVITIHDLIALLYGSDITFFSRMYFGYWMPFTYSKASKIIAISEHTKNDIVKLLRIPEEKIKVIYLAADKEIYSNKFPKLEIDRVKKKYQIKKRYLLHIGTLNPRKNLEFLIKVFSEVVKHFNDLQLVITGKFGWYYEGLFKLTKELNLEDKVIFTGYLDDKDKPILYQGSEIFVFPSLYEGFGLPPLEAMISGIPVIAANTSSIPEVVGNSGILLSPTDQLAWVRSIKQLLYDNKLQQKLSQKGLQQANRFSWEICARETIKVYEEVAHLKDAHE